MSVIRILAGLVVAQMCVSGATYDYHALLESVLKNNTAIRLAENAVAAAETQWEIKTADRWPDIALHYDAALDVCSDDDSSSVSRSADVSISQELFRFGKEPADVHAARKTLITARNRYDIAVRDQVFLLRESLIDLFLVIDEIRLRQVLVDEFKQRYVRMEGRLEAGNILPIDAKEAKLAYLDESVRIKQLRRKQREYVIEIMDIACLPDVTIPEEISVSGSLDSFTVKDGELGQLKAVINDGIAERLKLSVMPDMIKLQQARVRYTYLQWLPTLESEGLQAYYRLDRGEVNIGLQNPAEGYWRSVASLDGILVDDDQSSSLYDAGDWGVSVSLSVPLLKGFERFHVLKQEKTALEDLYLDLESEIRSIKKEIAAAYFDLQNYIDLVEIERERVAVSKERMMIVEELVELPIESYITYDDVLRRRQDFTQAQQNYFDVRRNYLLAAERFRKTNGSKMY